MGLRNIIAKRDQLENSQGQPLAGALIYLYEPGTTTFIQAFKDSGLTQVHTSPVRASGSGRANIWINRDCDLRIEDRNGNLILTEDNANPDALGAANQGGLLTNAGFEEDTNADGTPDFWVQVDVGGSTNARDTTESTEGAASFRFTSAGTGGGSLTSENFFPVNDVDDLRVSFDIRSTVAAVRNIFRVEWYDVSQVSISDSDPYDSTANPLTYTSFQFDVTPPAGARFAKVRCIGIDPSVPLAGSTYFDNLSAAYPVIVAGVFDNIEIRDNEIISTNTNGEIDIKPNGTGPVNITSSNVVDLVDINNPVNVSQVVDPSTNPHIAFDASQIQAKADATTAAALVINPLGGNTTIGTILEVDRANERVTVIGDSPELALFESDASVDNRRWDWSVNGEILTGRLLNDAGGAFASWMLVQRTANTVDAIQFLGPTTVTTGGLTVTAGGLTVTAGGQVITAGDFQMDAGRQYLAEVAAGGDIANFGQVYVNASNVLIYRDENGVETNLLLGSGTPGGADTQLQYNNGGVFGGISNLTFDDGNPTTTDLFTLTGNAALTSGAVLDISSNVAGKTGGVVRISQDDATAITTAALIVENASTDLASNTIEMGGHFPPSIGRLGAGYPQIGFPAYGACFYAEESPDNGGNQAFSIAPEFSTTRSQENWTNDTTYRTLPDLTMTFNGSTYYKFDFFILFVSGVDAKFRINQTSGSVGLYGTYTVTDDTGVFQRASSITGSGIDDYGEVIVDIPPGVNSDAWIQCSGYCICFSGGDLEFQAAQNTSSGAQMRIELGSWSYFNRHRIGELL